MIAEKLNPALASIRAMEKAEAARVAEIIARDTRVVVRTNAKAKTKRRGETHSQWKARLDKIAETEKPISERDITPETARHGDYRDESVYHIETNTQALVKRNRMTSSLMAMHARGVISDAQIRAAIEIARVAEMIERAVSIKGQAIADRVDGGGGGIGPLEERLTLVRLERAYTAWRSRLPMPRRLIIDMITQDQAMFATARAYHMSWPAARTRLIYALDRWEIVKDWAWANTDEDDVRRVACKIG